MITGNGALSLRKKDLENQKVPALGFRKTVFAHKASAGETGINLTSLTTPSELASNGFSQPPTAELTNAQLLFYRNNLKLVSSARGVLMDFTSYTVTSSTRISFLGFTALEGEIFYGVIDYNAQTGVKVVDASPIIATGSLAVGQTDFNTGVPFKVNQYASQNVGAVLVYVDRVIQQRNTGNSSSVKDKDYYEVDSGTGLGTIIRFNSADPDLAREITVVSNGLLSERPDGSMMAVIESLSGYVDNISTVVAQLTGLAASSVKGAAPTNVDLKNFGDRVFAVEANRSRIDQDNAWTASQSHVGRTTGVAPVAGQIGEVRSFPHTSGTIATATISTPVDVYSITLPAGIWMIFGNFSVDITTAATITTANSIYAAIYFTDAANTGLLNATTGFGPWNNATAAGEWTNHISFAYPIAISTSTTFKVRLQCSQSAAAAVARVYVDGTTFLSGSFATAANIKAVRIG